MQKGIPYACLRLRLRLQREKRPIIDSVRSRFLSLFYRRPPRPCVEERRRKSLGGERRADSLWKYAGAKQAALHTFVVGSTKQKKYKSAVP